MWSEFLATLFGLMVAFSAPVAIAILIIQRVARWDADRVIAGRKGMNVHEVNQLIDVLMWFKSHVKEADRDRVRKLRHLKRRVAS